MSLRRFIDRACAARGTSPFVWFRGRTWTYDDLAAITDGAAAEMRALGIVPGDRVAMLMPNGPEHLFAWLAAAKLGAIACPIHPELSPPEVAAALQLLEPAALLFDWSLSATLTASPRAFGSTRILIDSGERPAALANDAPPGTGTPRAPGRAHLGDLLASRRALADVPEPAPDAVVEILTTSGTTGKPKAVMIPHRMAVLTGEAFASWLGLGADDRLFTCLPLSHINARAYSALGAIAAGASLALEERFSASRFWGWLAWSGATQFNAIGAMLKILLARPEAPEDRAHGARLAYGALALGEEAHRRFEERFGLHLVIGYGLTESTFGFIHPLSGPRNFDSMGLPRRHPDPTIPADVRLVVEEDDRTGTPRAPSDAASGDSREAAPGEAGEIQLRNPATFSGYWRDEEATRAAFADGWLRTGDLARRDTDGSYVFAGRLKQMIRRRGENLTPAEVEAAIESHPAVLEVAVIGVPSPLGEDDVRAYVVLHRGASASPEDLAAHCASRLAPFKVPSQWRFLDRLPRTPTARIAYHLLDASLKRA